MTEESETTKKPFVSSADERYFSAVRLIVNHAKGEAWEEGYFHCNDQLGGPGDNPYKENAAARWQAAVDSVAAEDAENTFPSS